MKKDNTAKTLWTIFIIVLAISLALEFTMHPHVTFGIEGWPFFNAIFGFMSCAAIIFVSKFLGIFLKRKENYYKELRDDNK